MLSGVGSVSGASCEGAANYLRNILKRTEAVQVQWEMQVSSVRQSVIIGGGGVPLRRATLALLAE